MKKPRIQVTYKQLAIANTILVILLIPVLYAVQFVRAVLGLFLLGIIFLYIFFYWLAANRCSHCGKMLGRCSPVRRKGRNYWVSYSSCPRCSQYISPDDVIWILLPYDTKHQRKADALEKKTVAPSNCSLKIDDLTYEERNLSLDSLIASKTFAKYAYAGYRKTDVDSLLQRLQQSIASGNCSEIPRMIDQAQFKVACFRAPGYDMADVDHFLDEIILRCEKNKLSLE